MIDHAETRLTALAGRRTGPTFESRAARRPDAVRRLAAVRHPVAVVGLGLAVALLLTVVPSVLAATPSKDTFGSVTREATLVVLVRIHHRSTGALVLDVERVLKGSTRRRLRFQPGTTDVPLYTWTQALIAFRDPSSLDFRSPTIAWHVTADGGIDPEGYQQFPGTPRTLRGVFAAFDLPATSTALPVSGPPKSPLPIAPCVSLAVGLAAYPFVWRRRRRPVSVDRASVRFTVSPDEAVGLARPRDL